MASGQVGSGEVLFLRLIYSISQCHMGAVLPAVVPGSVEGGGEEAAAPESAEGSQLHGPACGQAGCWVREYCPGRQVNALHRVVQGYWICWVRKFHWSMAVNLSLHHTSLCLAAWPYLILPEPPALPDKC